MTNCIFCRIIEGSAPSEILYSNANAISILDKRPIHYGHALIIPRCHCGTFLEIPKETMVDLMEATTIVTKALVQSLQLEGFNIFSNNGQVAGQSVFHFHWHVTPRYPNDNIRFELTLKEYSDANLVHYGQRIREHISSTV